MIQLSLDLSVIAVNCVVKLPDGCRINSTAISRLQLLSKMNENNFRFCFKTAHRDTAICLISLLRRETLNGREEMSQPGLGSLLL